MSEHTKLLMAVRASLSSPDTRTFIVGWCLAGMSEVELTRLVDAIGEFESANTREKYLELVTERYGQPRPL